MSKTDPNRARHLNPLDLILAAIGAVLMFVAAFLPMWDTEAQKNTLIQSGSGIFYLITAVAVAYTIYRFYTRDRASFWLAFQGAWAVGWTIHDAVSKSLNTLYPIGLDGHYITSQPIHTSPGMGIWMAGVGAGLVLFAGLHVVWESGPRQRPSRKFPFPEPQVEAGDGENLLAAWDGVDRTGADRITRRALKRAASRPAHARRAPTAARIHGYQGSHDQSRRVPRSGK